LSSPGGESRVGHTSGRVALITGVTGQDGACLAQLLLAKGYGVVGTTRDLAHANLWRIEEAGLRDHPRLKIEQLDLVDTDRCTELVAKTQPTEVYNLGGLSFIGRSFAEPVHTARTTGLGAINLLDAIRVVCPGARFFQASSSEMFGNAMSTPQFEDTPFHPRSPYATAKLFAHWATVTYRDSFGVFAASGILYNHESPLRATDFVTRKITDAVARIQLGLQETVELGNLAACRDWGYAPEYAEAMWRMLQTDAPDTFVLASGRLTPVRKFVEMAFRTAGVEIGWQGHGMKEIGCDSRNGKLRVRVSPEFFRQAETYPLCGDASKAQTLLGWKAETRMDEICRIMVEKDIERLGAGGLA
jgi:GDPmannose 4,6-dehydratase